MNIHAVCPEPQCSGSPQNVFGHIGLYLNMYECHWMQNIK